MKRIVIDLQDDTRMFQINVVNILNEKIANMHSANIEILTDKKEYFLVQDEDFKIRANDNPLMEKE